ncbi:MAG TPA: hypothetical protein VGL09_04320 [Methylomirabilota bacterium]
MRARLSFIVIDVVSVSVSWLLAYWLRARFRLPWRSPAVLSGFLEYMQLLPLMLLVWIIVFDAFGLYAADASARRRGHRGLVAGVAACVAIVLILPLTLAFPAFGRGMLIYFCVVVMVVAALPRWLLERRAVGAFPNVAAAGAPAIPTAPAHAPAIRRTAAAPPAGQSAPVARRSVASPTFAVGVLVVLIFNLVWYGWFLSFPMFSEDAAANYSFLLESVREAGATSHFPIKWLEGLGQPNLFVTAVFDPFSWPFLTALDPATAMRISYALRATTAWTTAYLLVTVLFRRHRAIALVAASVYMVMTFTLAHPWGNRLFAGMFNGTHAALFPALLLFYWQTARQKRLVGWPDAALALTMTVFLLAYPIGSLLGVFALGAFALAVVVTAGPALRARGVVTLVKLCLLTALLLFAPVIGMYHAWSAVAAVAARNVFAEEITTYSPQYLLPEFWHDVPLPLRLVVLVALLAAILGRRWPRPLRVVVITLVAVVGLSQAWTVARAFGLAARLVERLPRPFYMEDYVAVLYATVAAYVLFRADHLRPSATPRWWPLRLAVVVAGTTALLSRWIGLATTVALVLERGAAPPAPGRHERPRWLPATAVVVLLAAVVLIFVRWPEQIHPLFGETLLCRDRAPWCRDAPGLTMGAAATPITDFLAAQLAAPPEFRGRAEFVIVPPMTLRRFPISPSSALTPAEFEALRTWWLRATVAGEGARRRFGPGQGQDLVAAMEELVARDELPEDVVLAIVQWAARHPDRVAPVELVGSGEGRPEVALMVQERDRNFRATGNGMLLRALPFHGIPVASSYEQALDYLYYLLWTRYVNEGGPRPHSFNFTTLATVHPERLALVGVRYVVARDVPLRAPPPLPRAFGWNGYSVYDVPAVNARGYAPTTVLRAETLADELRILRQPGFDPARMAVVAADAGPGDGEAWAPLAASSIRLDRQALLFEARSAGRGSIAVLPFRYSHCWRPEWTGAPGRVIRADVALLAVIFEDATRVRLRWTAGYGRDAGCLRADAHLRAQALDAARAMP